MIILFILNNCIFILFGSTHHCFTSIKNHTNFILKKWFLFTRIYYKNQFGMKSVDFSTFWSNYIAHARLWPKIGRLCEPSGFRAERGGDQVQEDLLIVWFCMMNEWKLLQKSEDYSSPSKTFTALKRLSLRYPFSFLKSIAYYSLQSVQVITGTCFVRPIIYLVYTIFFFCFYFLCSAFIN